MIVSAVSGQFLVVTQADHARFAADLLRLMPRQETAFHPRRELLLRAVADHDNGWWESDSSPRRNPTGTAPLDFREVDDLDRLEIWRRGIDRFGSTEPYVAAMVAGQALRLLGGRIEAGEAWRTFLGETVGRRDEFATAAGVTLEALVEDDGWLALADELSLALCTGDPTFVDRPGWRVDVALSCDGARLAVAPFPLAGATTLSLPCRLLEMRHHRSDAELARELALLRWRRIPVRVAPLA